DACATAGIAEAIKRGQRYLDAGVVILFVDALKNIDDAVALGRALDGRLIISMVEGNETAKLTPDELRQMGFSIALYPLSTLLRATYANRNLLADLKQNGTTQAQVNRMSTYSEFSEIVGLDHFSSTVSDLSLAYVQR
ncbi:MAG: hypothetical protein GY822_03425, partial [Deltaproteobacteria bacterium]|nr:hypothetical protein [Deltaproteobacteria bacterium]